MYSTARRSGRRPSSRGIIGDDDLVITPESGPIDTEMSDTSPNPVENRAIKAYVDAAIAAAIQSLNL